MRVVRSAAGAASAYSKAWAIGTESYDRDRDQYAARCIVESYEVIGDAHDWLHASDETDEDEDEDEDEDDAEDE